MWACGACVDVCGHVGRVLMCVGMWDVCRCVWAFVDVCGTCVDVCGRVLVCVGRVLMCVGVSTCNVYLCGCEYKREWLVCHGGLMELFVISSPPKQEMTKPMLPMVTPIQTPCRKNSGDFTFPVSTPN